MLNPFEWLVLGVIAFGGARVIWWVMVQIPSGHAKDEAICEKCLGKRMNDKVTEPLEWCDCPLRETSDKHFKHHHNECPDCQAGVGCTVCRICAPWLHGEEK